MQKTFKAFTLLSFICLAILMEGCKGKDDTTTIEEEVNEVYFAFTFDSGSERTATDAVLSKIVISVDDVSGTSILEGEEINLTQFAAGYLSDPISLTVGNYSLTKFLVLGEDDVAYYATPLEGSDLANLVTDPLPIEFEVALDEVTTVSPQVLSTAEGTVEEFGYSEFGFDIVETFDLLIGVLVYDEPSSGYELTEASIQIETEGDVLLNQDLFAATNKLTMPDGYDHYALTIEKEGYITYHYEFTADSLKSYQGDSEYGTLGVVLSSTDVSDGMIAYYPFNGNANDESGNGLDGTVVGASLTEDRNGIADAAYTFDGLDDYIDLYERTQFDLDQYDSYSISVWVRPVNAEIGVILSKYISASDNRMWWMSVLDGDVRYAVPQNGVSGLENTDVISNPIQSNVWQHVVVTYDGTDYSFFVDGEMKSTIPKTKDMLNASPTAKTLIGGVHFSSELFDVLFEGAIDEVRMYSRALSNDEIVLLSN